MTAMNNANFGWIFTAAVAVYALLWALAQMLLAKKRNWVLTVVRVGVTVASAVVSIPISNRLAELATDTVYGMVLPQMGIEAGGFMTEVPVGAEGLRVIVAMLVSPILYGLIFLVVRGILAIVCRIIGLALKHKPGYNAAVAMPLGAVNGVLIAVVTLIPLCGFLTMGAHLLETFSEGEMAEMAFVQDNVLEPMGMTADEVDEAAKDLENHPVVKTVHITVGKPVYKALTTAELDASATHGTVIEMNLETELTGLIITAGHATEVMESFGKDDYTADDKAVLMATGDAMLHSEWVKMLATDTLVALSEAWLAGEDFAGMQRPTLDATVQPILNRMLELLASESGATLEEDIHTILDVMGDFLMYDLLTDDTDYAAMLQRLGTSGILTNLLAKLEANERMAPLVSEIKATAMRLVSNMLGADKIQSGEYDEMMDSVAESLTNVLDMSKEERKDIITEAIRTDFADQGFDIPEDVAVEMSEQMIDELGQDGEITGDELKNYILTHTEDGFELLPDDLPMEDIPVEDLPS